MKKTLVAATTALFMSSAFAVDYNNTGMGTGEGETSTGKDMHMIESNVDSLVRGAYSFDKSKTRGSSADNDSQLDLTVNYAIKWRENWQFGTRLNYLKGTDNNGDQENYGFQVGAFYNFSPNLIQSFYVSLFTGLDWQHTYDGPAGNTRDEVWKTTLAAGKRFTLARWDIAHIVYSPEIAMVTANSTTGSKGSNLEYTQNIQLRFLQFSLFF